MFIFINKSNLEVFPRTDKYINVYLVSQPNYSMHYQYCFQRPKITSTFKFFFLKRPILPELKMNLIYSIFSHIKSFAKKQKKKNNKNAKKFLNFNTE